MADVAAALDALVAACEEKGLVVALYRLPLRVRVAAPGQPVDLSETVTCGPDGAGRLRFLCGWGEQIAPADEPETAAERLRRMVTVD